MLKFGRVGEVNEVSEVTKMWTASFTPVSSPASFLQMLVPCRLPYHRPFVAKFLCVLRASTTLTL